MIEADELCSSNSWGPGAWRSWDRSKWLRIFCLQLPWRPLLTAACCQTWSHQDCSHNKEIPYRKPGLVRVQLPPIPRDRSQFFESTGGSAALLLGLTFFLSRPVESAYVWCFGSMNHCIIERWYANHRVSSTTLSQCTILSSTQLNVFSSPTGNMRKDTVSAERDIFYDVLRIVSMKPHHHISAELLTTLRDLFCEISQVARIAATTVLCPVGFFNVGEENEIEKNEEFEPAEAREMGIATNWCHRCGLCVHIYAYPIPLPCTGTLARGCLVVSKPR